MNDLDCIFCKIITGELPSDRVYEDDLLVAFRDINPVAPTHILIVPRKHIVDNNSFGEDDEPIAGRMFLAEQKLAKSEGIHTSGYRLILNTGLDGRQEVPHLHLHLIGGHKMRHPMG